MPATADAVDPIELRAFNTGCALLAEPASEMPDRAVDEVTFGACRYALSAQPERGWPATRVSA
ncbi:hypothetical protein GCM10023191_031600 [Actinoallomurus oryzae]|uniref:Uncharacterized protein n=1 Tax=Actinoallomurus oryzae TaxID=502180 RepID=A0ABP8PZ64_9ACTN